MNTPIKTRNFPIWLSLGRLITGLMLCQSVPAYQSAAAAGEDLAAQISRTHVFYQPFAWVGSAPPAAAENETLWAAVEKMKGGNVEENIPALEEFIADHPHSPWVPSLEANLGRYYRERGLYSKALEHWRAAWEATKNAPAGPAKQVADFTFAYWTRLLASLGRVDTLTALYQETHGRVFDGGALQQIINSAREGYRTMLADPGVCFRCGTYALHNVGRVLKGPAFNSREIDRLPSPVTGFSMSKLVEESEKNGLDLVAANWNGDKKLVVPSVIHWKENHYAAIVAEKNGRYRVIDPTFDGERWITGADIASEVSGQFLVPKDKMPKDWKLLAKAETDQIYGRGHVRSVSDNDDCCSNGSGSSNPFGGGPGGPGGLGGGPGSGPFAGNPLGGGPRGGQRVSVRITLGGGGDDDDDD